MENKEKNKMNQEPLTTGQIAEYCHVTYRAVLKWITEGKLPAYRTPGKHSRVSVEDFMAFLNKYHMPVPAELSGGEQRQRILIVDDDKRIVELIRNALQVDELYDIQVAYDGFKAGQKFCEFRPNLIVLDINMPNLDGYGVCSYIREDLGNKKVKILSVSGEKQEDAVERILKLGANDFLAKPFAIDALKKKIKKLISLFLIFSLCFSHTAFALGEDRPAFQNYFIQQEIVENDGVWVSRPKILDESISHIIYRHDIQSLEDYGEWLEEHTSYKEDGHIDVWAKPEDFLRDKHGDCEDYTFLTMSVARVFGYQPHFYALVRKGKAHAICAFKYNGYYVWFDNSKLFKTEATNLDEFAKQVLERNSYLEVQELDVETKEWSTIYKKS